ncbi:heavy metal sensor histidine kinase [Stutzerimonas stutzeri ATCC 14405 = CCUG 16156]|uniref:heavy metal sensor histidine kinase n=1 Tax=Stutzerimonas stutzeri TaxID=316 RepID=UPI00025492DC|nr:heavy metal sensor histidine kinase [Stutzerimonas stutzeri]EHY79313.1 heavy metal sensor histidine kinase [Stutzerimonas stutzeri ATCC 14405 = CCUG 16156]QOZ94970.1 heavy metal sensor histidine kinase [Stutzerimonas stutzeri]
MRLLPRSLSLRLAIAFALVAVVLLGAIGLYLYRSLEREIVWRDDQALLGRLERMQALLEDSASVEALRQRPQLYENMLGNRDSLLWLLDAQGRALIEINPARLPIPPLPAGDAAALQDIGEARLAWRRLPGEAGLTLVAGRLLSEREQMLAAYRVKLWWALSLGALLASVLGWLISRRALRPVRHLTRQALAIDVQHLHLRLDESAMPSELEPLRAALNQMLARLEQGFARLSRFSEDLAHEMRTPLGNLMGQTQQLLHRARAAEDYQALLVSNQEEYERLARMIDSMLFLARAEQPAAIERQRFALPTLVEQLCDYFEGVAEERGIQLLDETEGELCGDPELIRRALANLIANALRYGASDSPVRIVSGSEDGWRSVSVINQGPAIAAEHLPRLFDRFYRCDPSRAEPGDSGGLGLAIVRSIMQLHGGEVVVHSDMEMTDFTLRFAETAA